jgi:hypothetical protein
MATQSNAKSVLTLNPELNARCTIIFNIFENLLPHAPLHFIDTIERNMWNEEGEEEKQSLWPNFSNRKDFHFDESNTKFSVLHRLR